MEALILGLCLGLGLPLGIFAGMIAGYFIALKVFKKQMKKNPPITESQIRTMYRQMGRTPTEKQVKQIMATFKSNIKKKS